MNEYNATGNIKPVSPTSMPMKDGMQGTTSRPAAAAPSETEAMRSQTIPQQDMRQSTFQPPMRQTGYFPPAMPQTGAAPPMTAQPSIFQPPQQAPQSMPMTGMQPRTSIMASGRGVRDSVLSDINFTQGFLQTQIGRHVKVEFLVGTNMLIDREGDLVRVGTDYIIIQETETDDYLLCDIYSIKFIRFYY